MRCGLDELPCLLLIFNRRRAFYSQIGSKQCLSTFFALNSVCKNNTNVLNVFRSKVHIKQKSKHIFKPIYCSKL